MVGVRVKIITFLIFLINLFLVPTVTFAHGGGGGRGGGGRGTGSFRGASGGGFGGVDFSNSTFSGFQISDTFIFYLVIAIVIILAVIGFIIWRFYKKKREAKAIIDEIEQLDNSWNLEDIERRIGDTFNNFYLAQKRQDMKIAKEYISDSLYIYQQSKINSLKSRNHRNVISNFKLKDIKIMGVGDYREDEKDYFWAYIRGSMNNYFVDTFTGKTVSGNPSIPKNVNEMWKFTRGPNGWVLDKIDTNILMELFKIKSFTEGNGNDSNNGYLVCEECNGYYMLGKDENPQEFDSCQCGGNLIYYNDLDEFLGDDDFKN